MTKKKKMLIAFLLGIVGCLCFGTGDWLMAYGDAAHCGKVWWLTEGVANISSTRNSIAMFIAFPGIICYGLGLFAAAGFNLFGEALRDIAGYTVCSPYSDLPRGSACTYSMWSC